MTDPGYAPVNRARKEFIHLAIYDWGVLLEKKGEGPFLAVKDIVTLCGARDGWPEATWPGARKGPPDYQQIRNYCDRLVKDGALRKSTGGMLLYAYATKPESRALRKRAPDVARLKSEGKKLKEIAEILGISLSLAASLSSDPTGERERERKKKYCPACGSKLDGSVDWCRPCKTRGAENLLPTPDYLAVMHRVEREQGIEMVMGVTPDCIRVIRLRTKRGMVEHQLRVTDTWDDALEELGLL